MVVFQKLLTVAENSTNFDRSYVRQQQQNSKENHLSSQQFLLGIQSHVFTNWTCDWFLASKISENYWSKECGGFSRWSSESKKCLSAAKLQTRIQRQKLLKSEKNLVEADQTSRRASHLSRRKNKQSSMKLIL